MKQKFKLLKFVLFAGFFFTAICSHAQHVECDFLRVIQFGTDNRSLPNSAFHCMQVELRFRLVDGDSPTMLATRQGTGWYVYGAFPEFGQPRDNQPAAFQILNEESESATSYRLQVWLPSSGVIFGSAGGYTWEGPLKFRIGWERKSGILGTGRTIDYFDTTVEVPYTFASL